MKTKIILTAFVASFFNLHSAFAQGALTPPGAPAPTMKTLAQIEPRTLISSVPFTITAPGSYYLTTNLTTVANFAIGISASGVTLDLNGFTIASSVPNATNGGTAILFTTRVSDIRIFNGHIRGGVTNSNGGGGYIGGGFANGIFYTSLSPVNVLVSHLSVSGCLNQGIFLGPNDSTVVEACTVNTVGGYGIDASVVKSCAALNCGDTAVYGDQVSDCRGASSGSGTGVYATTALNCDGFSLSGDGLHASTAQNCSGYSGSGTGVNTIKIASNCYGTSITGTGLSAFIANSCSGTSLSVTHNVNSF